MATRVKRAAAQRYWACVKAAGECGLVGPDPEEGQNNQIDGEPFGIAMKDQVVAKIRSLMTQAKAWYAAVLLLGCGGVLPCVHASPDSFCVEGVWP